jgi:ribosomal protein L29|tara:strand:- start:4405 stop:4737 length:333 start_codon:yes stop_codon:yes gene_type:complete
MAANNSQNGWNEYSKLVIAELERLNDGITNLNSEIQDLKRDLATMKVKEDFAKDLWRWKKEVDEVASPSQLKEAIRDVSELKTFKTQAITVWIVVQTLFGMALALIKFWK